MPKCLADLLDRDALLQQIHCESVAQLVRVTLRHPGCLECPFESPLPYIYSRFRLPTLSVPKDVIGMTVQLSNCRDLLSHIVGIATDTWVPLFCRLVTTFHIPLRESFFSSVFSIVTASWIARPL